MAKKSAASKGYRKTVKKKPFLTKKEIIALIVIVAAIIVVVVAFNLFYDDGYLRLSDVQPNDVVTTVSREINNRYLKVAESLEVDGFTRTNEYRDVNPASTFTYTPDEPTDNISNITLGGSYRDAVELSESSISSLNSLGANANFAATEIQNVTVQGHDACLYSYTMDYYEESADADSEDIEEEAEEEIAEEESDTADGEAEAADEEAEAADEEAETAEPASNRFSQAISLYISANQGQTVCFHINRIGDDDSYYLPEDELLDYALAYADQMFTVYDGTEDAA